MKNFLYEHAAKRPVSFHMPGHKGSSIFKKYGYGKFLENFMDMDVTEIPGADNLFDANGIISAVQERYAALYGARRSWLSVGGTSASLIASILAVCDMENTSGHGNLSDPEKGKRKIIMARNCHKAVFNGLRLAGAVPVYAYPDIDPVNGISGAVSPRGIKRLISENPDAVAVIVTSPDYYGVCSDIESIARICHDAGMVLIVDQAHGAHLKFFHACGCGNGMPLAAEDQGADIVCNSTHKTLASMTQSAVLNLCSDDPCWGRTGFDIGELAEKIEEKLQMIESSSPSYVLMTSLEICAELLEEHGPELMKQWRSSLDYFYEKAAKIEGLGIMFSPGDNCVDSNAAIEKNAVMDNKAAIENAFHNTRFDSTKLNLDLGMPGADAEKLLNERGIFPELYAGDLLMCMTGIGNKREDYDALLDALKEIMDSSHKGNKGSGTDDLSYKNDQTDPAAAYPQPGRFTGIPLSNRKIHFTEAEGKICAVSIIPYPPGIPLVCPGEEITSEVISFINDLLRRNEKILGIDNNGIISIGT